MLSRITKFLGKSNFIYEHQFGFQKNKSTNFAVLNVHTRIVNSLGSGELAWSVFFDFGKGFCCAYHKILISKLKIYGL